MCLLRKTGGRLQLGVKSLSGWESRAGREGSAPREPELVELGINPQPAGPGPPPSPPPPRAEMEFAGRSRSLPGLPHRHSTPLVTLQPWAGGFGKEGDRVSSLQSALILWRVHRASPEKVHGRLVLKAGVPPR